MSPTLFEFCYRNMADIDMIELLEIVSNFLGRLTGDSASQNGQGKAVDVDKPLDAKAAAQLSAAQ